MLKWVFIIAFNIVFGLVSGFITSRIFNSRDWNNSNWYFIIYKEDMKMILCVAFASTLAGIFYYSLIPKSQSIWRWAGILFGSTVPVLTFLFLHVLDLYHDLVLRPKPGVILDTKIKLIVELYRSFNFIEFFVIAMFTLLYGWVSLLVPVLGLAWGYLMYKCRIN